MNELQKKIISIGKEQNALILAHYYQELEIQDIADNVGDSFALAKLAQGASEDTIILCGVRFMAESAKILNPMKTVYLPSEGAGCPMADMITPEDVLKLRSKYPEAAVVCYVNSTAEVKAVSDICCTSSSAEKIVRSLSQRQIIFIPDKNLGAHIAKKIPDKEFIFSDGYCPIHNNLSSADALDARRINPDAVLLAHPECRAELLDEADFVGSTSEIIDYSRKTDNKNFIISTEDGVYKMLKRDMPDKNITLIKNNMLCPDMKKTTLFDILACLEGKREEITLDKGIMDRARLSLERMVGIE